jgi:hypothetical protein
VTSHKRTMAAKAVRERGHATADTGFRIFGQAVRPSVYEDRAMIVCG